MIKLFETYNNTYYKSDITIVETASKIIDKLNIFFKELGFKYIHMEDEKSYDYNDSVIYITKSFYNDIIFLFQITDALDNFAIRRWTLEFGNHSENREGITLEHYIFDVISEYLKDSSKSETPYEKYSSVYINDITPEIVEKINFVVEDYMTYKDSERFGL